MGEYFECKSGELCKEADCCKSYKTVQSFCLADYIRLAEHEDISLEYLWRSKGDVCLSSHDNIKPGEFLLYLGLKHDPCPYLDGHKCSVHEIKPLACGTFPLLLYTFKPEIVIPHYKDFKCLQNVELPDDQLDLIKDVKELYDEFTNLDKEYLFPEPIVVKANSKFMVKSLIDRAIDKMAIADPQMQTEKSKILLDRIEKERSLPDYFLSDIDDFLQFIRPVVHIIFEDYIAKRLKLIDKNVKKKYKPLNEKWIELNKKLS
ncbi:YkgJ family cysteine cluster protein [Nanoarchaeota archaeon]